MKNLIQQKITGASLLVMALLLICFVACKKEPTVNSTSSQVNITGYLEQHPEKFSEFRKILEITGNDGFLQAYGNYTIFLPTNEGVNLYLKDIGKTSVDQIDLQDLKNLVRFHLLEDTIATTRFGDGKLTSLTMLGQYLITGATNTGGVTKITINRQANLDQGNIRVGNGYIHVIDHVLQPAKLTLSQIIEANPGYSIFTAALKETGLYDSLNILPANNQDPDTTRHFLTVIAESDQVLASAGIASYTALKEKFSNSADLKNPANGLHAFIAYHVLLGAKYMADIASAQGHTTLSKPEILTAKLQQEKIIINDMEFNGTYEPGFTIDRSTSDISASNGVFHSAAPYSYNYTYKNNEGQTITATGTTTGHFVIKARVPFPVYWDVADFPEIRSKSAIFRGTGTFVFSKTSATAPSPINGWWWPKTGQGPTYLNDKATFVNGDYLQLFLGNLAGNARQEYFEIKTPLIVRGRYNIWVCYRRQLGSGTWPTAAGVTTRVSVDGEFAERTFNFGEPPPAGSTTELESLGWKYYTSTGNTASPFQKFSGNTNYWISKKVGVVEIKSTDVHTLRLDALKGTQSQNNLDMIHFIPIDWPSQILPRFKVDGTMDYTDYPGTH